MLDRLTITLTRQRVKEMATRLRTFLATDDRPLKSSTAYEATAQTLGFANWNTLSASLPDDREKTPKSSKQEQDSEFYAGWVPRIETNTALTHFRSGATLVVIPSQADHRSAIDEIHRSLDPAYRHFAIVGSKDEWPSSSDHVAFMFDPSWKEDPVSGVNNFLHFQCRSYVLTPLIDEKLLHFIIFAKISGLNIFGFIVADSFNQAMCRLIEMKAYSPASGTITLLFSKTWWPEDTVLDPTASDQMWHHSLNRRLASERDANADRFPLYAVTPEAFNEIVRLSRLAEDRSAAWAQGSREEPISTVTESAEVTAKFDTLSKMTLWELIELRALVRLAHYEEADEPWEATLGRAMQDLQRNTIFSNVDFVGGTYNLSKTLLKGLRLLKEKNAQLP